MDVVLKDRKSLPLKATHSVLRRTPCRFQLDAQRGCLVRGGATSTVCDITKGDAALSLRFFGDSPSASRLKQQRCHSRRWGVHLAAENPGPVPPRCVTRWLRSACCFPRPLLASLRGSSCFHSNVCSAVEVLTDRARLHRLAGDRAG